jgi:N-acetylmuramoyl-L-alanine amidase
MHAEPVVFRLEDSSGKSVSRASRAFVSMKAAEFPLTGITKGKNATLSYGLGEDRLGGAVMQRLVSGVRLSITGKMGGMYRVRLAEGREAWIDQDMVDIRPGGIFGPHTLTGNWQVYGDEQYDYVSVGLDERVPYASYQETSPDRIVVDLFGTSSNTNWIIQQLNTREIANVAYRQEGKDIFRILVDLKHHQPWGYGISYNGANLVIRVKRQPERLTLKAMRIVLDAGHGGDNLGARGSTGALEKDVNLATALHVKSLLEDKGASVVLTRGADSAVTMTSRLSTALASNADLLIAIHSNSIGLTTNPEDTRGVSTYYKHIGFRPLSKCILDRIVRTGLPAYGNVGSFNFLLNAPTEMPNVLVELAYMSNPEDEMKLLDDEFRWELAKAIVKGAQDFLDACDE